MALLPGEIDFVTELASGLSLLVTILVDSGVTTSGFVSCFFTSVTRDLTTVIAACSDALEIAAELDGRGAGC